MATQSWVFAYLLWTLKDVINIVQKYDLTEEQTRVRKTLEKLTQCLQDKFLKQLIEDILGVLLTLEATNLLKTPVKSKQLFV